MKEKEVLQVIKKMLKQQGWTAEVESWVHPSDNSVTVRLFRIKELK